MTKKKRGSIGTLTWVQLEQGCAKVHIPDLLTEMFGFMGGEMLLITLDGDNRIIIERAELKVKPECRKQLT